MTETLMASGDSVMAASACRKTHVPSGTIKPEPSANGLNVWGPGPPLRGGGSEDGIVGAEADWVVERDDGTGEVIRWKRVTRMNRGDRLVVSTAGGGGYGDPQKRDRAAVRNDVRNGKISAGAAREVYGLVD